MTYKRKQVFKERALANDSSVQEADITVTIKDNWFNLHEIIRSHCPGGRSVYDGVAFTRGQAIEADWQFVLNCLPFGSEDFEIVASPNRVVFLSAEPAVDLYFPWHDGQGDGTRVWTCDPGAPSRPGNHVREYFVGMSPTRTWSVYKTYDYLKHLDIRDKPGSLSFVCSNLNILQGHRDRLKFLKAAKQKIEFDHYGRGFLEVHDKWNATAPYKYSIGYENSVSDYTITEKINDIFLSQAMPIYVGSPKITDFFPEESLVVIDPDDPDVFRIIEDTVKSDLWHKRRDAILESKRRVLDEYNIVIRMAAYVRERQDEPPAPKRRMKIAYQALKYS
jgi:hypothetical protein